jgi:anhydro-N-acetylmuramic acid kinase
MSMTVIGLISGTSYDAVDAAAARMRLEGDTLFLIPLGLHSVPIPAPVRARIAAVLPPNRTTVDEICRLDTTIGQLFGSVAADANTALTGGTADLVSSHGQTVYHWVDSRTALGTLQLGEPAWIAEAGGLPVVSGLRSRDITRGGQGVPLVSLLDALLPSSVRLPPARRPCASQSPPPRSHPVSPSLRRGLPATANLIGLLPSCQ